MRAQIGAGERQHIARRGTLSGGGQSIYVLELRMLHAEGPGLAVHLAYKVARITADFT